MHLGLVNVDKWRMGPRFPLVNVCKLLPFEHIFVMLLSKWGSLNTRILIWHDLHLFLEDILIFLIWQLMAFALLQKLICILISKIKLYINILGPNSGIPLALIKANGSAIRNFMLLALLRRV
jgi:hypothetical protein